MDKKRIGALTKALLENLIYLPYALMWIISFLSTTTLVYDITDIQRDVIRAIVFVFFVLLITLRSKWTASEIVCAVFLTGTLYISFRFNGWTDLNLSYDTEFLLLIIASKALDTKKAVRVYIYVTAALMCMVMFKAFSGEISNLIYYQAGHGNVARMSMGICYPTDFAAHMFFLAAAYLWVRNPKQISNKKELVGSILDIVTVGLMMVMSYVFCNARFSSICMILLIILYSLRIVSLKYKINLLDKLKTCYGWIMVISMPALALFMEMISRHYHETPFYTFLNNLFSNRFSQGNTAFYNYQLLPFGQEVTQVGFGGTNTPVTGYFFLDSSYISVLFRYGYLVLIAVVAVWVVRSFKLYKNRRWLELGIAAVIACQCAVEHHLLELTYNWFLFLIFSEDRKDDAEAIFGKFLTKKVMPYIRLLIVGAGIVLLSLLYVRAGHAVKNDKISELDVQDVQIIEKGDEAAYSCVDFSYYNISEQGEPVSVTIRGWALLTGIDSAPVVMNVVLKDGDTYFRLPTNYAKRKDVTEHFFEIDGTEVNYDKSGYISYLRNEIHHFPWTSDKLDIYILCRVNGEKYLINTGKSLSN